MDLQTQEPWTKNPLSIDKTIPTAGTVEASGKVSNNQSIINRLILFERDKQVMSKLAQVFYDQDAFKEPLHDPSSHSKTNIYLTVIFHIGTLAYAVYSGIMYLNRPEITTFSLRQMSKAPVQYLRVETKCTTKWGCMKNPRPENGSWVADEYPWIDANFPTTSMKKKWSKGPWTKRNYTNVPLEFSPLVDNCVEIKVPDFFVATSSNCSEYGASCAPVLRLEVTANNPESNGPMKIIMDLEPHQRKAIYIGVIIHEFENGSSTYELYNQDLFYEGKNAIKAASLKVRASQFAEVFTTSRSGSFADCFADVGGFSAILLSILGVLGIPLNMIFEKK